MLPANLTDTKQPLDPLPVKADDHVAINDRDRGCPKSKLLQFLQRLLVFQDILWDELHTLLRKKLFLLLTKASVGLSVNDYLFRHD